MTPELAASSAPLVDSVAHDRDDLLHIAICGQPRKALCGVDLLGIRCVEGLECAVCTDLCQPCTCEPDCECCS